MTNPSNELIEAIQHGDLQTIQTLLDPLLLHESPEIQYEIADLFVQFGFLQEAKRVYEHIQFLFPEEAQLKIDLASVFIELGQEDEALELLVSVTPDTPEYAQSLLLLADYYQMQGLYEVAEKQINEALSLLPNEPLLKFAKAELLFETGRFVEAATIYEQLHKMEKTIAGVMLAERLAEVYRAGAGYETALHYYMEVLEEKVTADLLFGSAYAAFQCEKYEVAIAQLEDLKQLDPDYFSAYLLLAESYAMIEDNKKALTTIQEGLTRDEYDKALYLFAGKIALKNNMPDEAVHYLQQAIALDPEYMEAIFILMSIFEKHEQYDEIIELYETLKSEQFDWIALYPIVAESYSKDEQYDRAYEIYQLAYTEFKEDPLFLEKYCYFLIEEGRREQARDIVRQLLSLQPSEQQWHDLYDTLE